MSTLRLPYDQLHELTRFRLVRNLAYSDLARQSAQERADAIGMPVLLLSPLGIWMDTLFPGGINGWLSR